MKLDLGDRVVAGRTPRAPDRAKGALRDMATTNPQPALPGPGSKSLDALLANGDLSEAVKVSNRGLPTERAGLLEQVLKKLNQSAGVSRRDADELWKAVDALAATPEGARVIGQLLRNGNVSQGVRRRAAETLGRNLSFKNETVITELLSAPELGDAPRLGLTKGLLAMDVGDDVVTSSARDRVLDVLDGSPTGRASLARAGLEVLKERPKLKDSDIWDMFEDYADEPLVATEMAIAMHDHGMRHDVLARVSQKLAEQASPQTQDIIERLLTGKALPGEAGRRVAARASEGLKPHALPNSSYGNLVAGLMRAKHSGESGHAIREMLSKAFHNGDPNYLDTLVSHLRGGTSPRSVNFPPYRDQFDDFDRRLLIDATGITTNSDARNMAKDALVDLAKDAPLAPGAATHLMSILKETGPATAELREDILKGLSENFAEKLGSFGTLDQGVLDSILGPIAANRSHPHRAIAERMRLTIRGR